MEENAGLEKINLYLLKLRGKILFLGYTLRQIIESSYEKQSVIVCYLILLKMSQIMQDIQDIMSSKSPPPPENPPVSIETWKKYEKSSDYDRIKSSLIQEKNLILQNTKKFEMLMREMDISIQQIQPNYQSVIQNYSTIILQRAKIYLDISSQQEKAQMLLIQVNLLQDCLYINEPLFENLGLMTFQ